MDQSLRSAIGQAEARLHEALDTYERLFLSRVDSTPVNSQGEEAAYLEIVDATTALRDLRPQHEIPADADTQVVTGAPESSGISAR